MALVAETLVEEWLNRKGCFTIRVGAKGDRASKPVRQDERSIAVCETLYIRVVGTRSRKERGVLLQFL